MARKITKESLARKWAGITKPIAIEWAKRDGKELLITPGGYASLSDMSRKLIRVSKSDFIRGRDEGRVERFLKAERRSWLTRAISAMTVFREVVIGRNPPIKTRQVLARDVLPVIKDELR